MKTRTLLLSLLTLVHTIAMTTDTDPYLWLEDINGERALNWVREQNRIAEQALAQNSAFKQSEADILAILDADDKIPAIQKRGDYYYNYWQDKNHPRGIWRRTSLDEYRKPDPQWETLLDLDALNREENANWVWHGAQCLRPDYTRCLITLSRGGADADETREYDLNTRSFLKDGYYRPEAKGSMTWKDKDHVYIQTDFGAGTTTSAGYPRETRLWKRGTPLESAELIYRGEENDMYISAYHDSTPGYERDFINRTIAFYNSETYWRKKDGSLQKIEAPNSVEKDVHRDWLTFTLREDWHINGQTYPGGSLLVANFNDWMAGKRELTVLYQPGANSALHSAVWSKNQLVLNILEDVKNRLTILDPAANWQARPFHGAPKNGSVQIGAVDPDDSDQYWMTATGFTTPTTLYLADGNHAPEKLKSSPAYYNADDYQVSQHFATSKDGSKIPYYLVNHKTQPNDGKNPTLLYGYGGFEISLTPYYSGSIGKSWLTRQNSTGRHGAYAIANIRGGGEYGPRWHQAALKEKRHKAYEDFVAVARDLAARGIADAAHLGIQGGSNGGLLMGNMLTQYPEDFGAIVIQVPLLDMQRYHKLLAGASWIAEYGDPDKPEEWAYLQHYSPYHQFNSAKTYPPVLFTTSTRDDRVHPGHARKMMAKMHAAGKNVYYYENIEGGHGGAADNKQRAYMTALAYQFLWERLNKSP